MDIATTWTSTLMPLLSNAVQATIGGFTRIVHSIQDDRLLTLVPACILAAAMIEWARVGWAKSTLGRLREIGKIDVFSFLLMQFNLIGLLGHVFTGFIAYALYATAKHAGVAELGWMPVQSPFTVVLYCVTLDFLCYWFHRIHHTQPALWALHHFHHSAPHFNLLAAFRNHPVQNTLSKLGIVLPLGILFELDATYASQALLLYFLVSKVLAILQHSHLDADWGWLGEILMSPAAHKAHHSLASKHFDKNYGTNLIIWDKWFGTYYRVTSAEAAQIQIGVHDFDPQVGVWRYLVDCVRQSVRQLLGRPCAPHASVTKP